ncbi:unnamed protein product [Anisakis simplex]|uniref:CHCH domain-containing protein n=1 Tax=Anisakis simplex TaxID=6269 RepID=A0A3P6RPG8_ANISI|nr:unnamed protein product [Anisakis simplex]
MALLGKKGLVGLIATEVILFGGAFLGFCHLRRSEQSRQFLYRYTPSIINLYYRMSGQAGPFSRVTTVSPPLKGSFPLDHEGECKLSMLNYMICLHENKNVNDKCRHLAKAYLKCRMDNDLMTKEDMAKLGFSDKDKDTS